MSKSARIAEKIAASQARMDRDSPALPATIPPSEAYPPEDYRSLVAEYPWLAVAAGLGLGALAGALLPKSAGSKFGKRAVAFSMMAAEIGVALSKQAGDKASEASRDGVAVAKDRTRQFQRTARSAGETIAREAIRLAARARR